MALTMSHVLLIEADLTAQRLLQAVAELHGLTWSPARSAAEAIDRIGAEKFDAILLDLGLPDRPGSHLISELRGRSDTPIIVLSPQSDQRTLVSALNAGADDFITNPLIPSELIARIRVAIERHADKHGDSVNGMTNPLASSYTSRLISLLESREGQLVKCDEIITAIWGSEKQRDERNLRVLVAKARRELKAMGEHFEIISEHGRGYRLYAKITEQVAWPRVGA
jgi:two-component system KDP operon response regulator KdpE